jgi:hypothetical protein
MPIFGNIYRFERILGFTDVRLRRRLHLVSDYHLEGRKRIATTKIMMMKVYSVISNVTHLTSLLTDFVEENQPTD